MSGEQQTLHGIRKIRRLMALAIVCVATLAILSHVPPVLIVAFFLLFFPGYLLVFANAALLYSLALLPAFFSAGWTGGKIGRIFAGIGLLLAVAVIPHCSAKAGFDAFEKEHRSEDFSLPGRVDVRTISLSLYTGTSCGDLCQRLLYGDHVEAVFVSNDVRTVRYRIERLRGCPDMPLEAGGRQRPLADACLVSNLVPIDTMADVHVVAGPLQTKKRSSKRRLTTDLEGSRGNWFRLWTAEEANRIEIYEWDGLFLNRVERRTHIAGAIAIAPFNIVGGYGGGVDVYPEVARKAVELSPGDVEDVLSRRYGWMIEEVPTIYQEAQRR